MGAGAGYTIETKNVRIDGDITINSFNINEVGDWQVTTVSCTVPIVGSVRGSSYNYGFGAIEDVAMTVNRIIINFYKSEEFPTVTEADIMEVLRNRANYEGKCVYGGGWSHVKFEGDLEISTNSDYSDDVEGILIQIDEDFVIDFIDVAVQGENIEYTAFYNDEVFETYNTLEEAINALKQEISEDVGAADPSRCYVESSYYYLINGGVNTFEYENDWDYSQVEYNAEDDFSGDLYDAIDELDEENEPDVDEGFDI